jgi:predicted amidohydrolase YtcJ
MLLTLLGGIAAASLYAIASRLWTTVPNPSYCYESVTSLSEKHPQVNCFEVSPSGYFAKVFSYNEVKDENLRLREGHVIPGLWDGHGHLLQYGEFLHSVDLFGASSLEEIRSRVVDYVVEHPLAGSSSEWIRGIGWDQAVFGRMPTAVSLLAPLYRI